MLRITQHIGSQRTTLRLEGRLSGRFVAEFISACESIELDSPLFLNLNGVTWIDEAGLDAVRKLIARRVNIEGCSAFVGQLLNGARS